MIEIIIQNYLASRLECGVYMEVPENPPEEFIVLERTEGSRTNKLRSASFAVRSYSGTLLKSAELNEAVKEIMDGLEELDVISACKFDRDYGLNDTATKRYRYQALYIITHY